MAVRSESLVARILPIAVVLVVAMVGLIPGVLEVLGYSDAAAAMGGDFPSFYAAGSIVLDGGIEGLYDPAVQQAYQEGFHDEGEYLFFAYPPFVAIGYAAIAWLPYGVSFALHTGVSLAALFAACWLALEHFTPKADLRRRIAMASALAIACYPILRAVLGGQNTTFSLALITGIWWASERDRTVLAGVLLVGLMAKPQFALVLLVVLIVARRWRSVATAAGGACALYLGTALWVGWAWPREWIEQVVAFGEANGVVNGPLMVNILGWVDAAVPGGATAIVTAVILLVAAIGGAVWAVVRAGVEWRSFGALASALVLLSPSALYYDAGIALFAFGVVAVIVLGQQWWVGAIVAVSWTQVLQPWLGWSPLFIVVCALFAISLVLLGPGGERVTPYRYTRRAGEADGGEDTWRVTG